MHSLSRSLNPFAFGLILISLLLLISGCSPIGEGLRSETGTQSSSGEVEPTPTPALPSPTATPTPQPTLNPTPNPTPLPTPTPTPLPTPTPTPLPTPTPTPSPRPTVPPTPTPVPTAAMCPGNQVTSWGQCRATTVSSAPGVYTLANTRAGYKGSVTATCQANGSWLFAAVDCSAIPTPTPTPVAGTVTLEYDRNYFDPLLPLGSWAVVPASTEEPLYVGTTFAGDAVTPEITLRLNNTMATASSISSITVGAPFEIRGTLPKSVGANSAVTIIVGLRNLSVGKPQSSLTVNTSAGARTVNLAGEVK